VSAALHGPAGPRERRLRSFLARRRKTARGDRKALDARAARGLFRERAVVFTDMADFTLRTARDGILHFLMLFDHVLESVAPVVRRSKGDIVKVEADSLLLRFDDAVAACRGVAALDAALRRHNRRVPADERVAFSYGIGFGPVLDLERDLFGLEVNLASKLGEDLAEPGVALLTPAAAAALDRATLRKVTSYRVVTLGRAAVPVSRLKL
jgi:class 3 adenylate cyclase